MEFIPTRSDHNQRPVVSALIGRLTDEAERLGFDDGVLYYGWPTFKDYDAVGHPVDLALLSASKGLIVIRVMETQNQKRLTEVDESIAQAAATATALMIKSSHLRTKRRGLKFDVIPVLYCPGYDGLNIADSEIVGSENVLISLLEGVDNQALSADDVSEARSILEGAKALSRPSRRILENPQEEPAAVALAALEEEIAKFDSQQRSVALTNMRCPQRIRGLAGSGKTVILAMKAALAHIENPTARILVTYYTRSLKDHLERLITRFHKHFGEGEPDWNYVHVHHGWGRRDLAGVYRETCIRSNVSPMSFSVAQQRATPGQNPFGYICENLIESTNVAAFYDLILIDEGQDFPDSFYQLCFFLAKGGRDEKQIVWAYDELQDIFDIKVRSAEDLYGIDDDGEPRVSLGRALPAHADTNDFVLPKCYRNQRDVLVLAHAIGFGLYGTPVQMLQNQKHWEDVGYELVEGDMKTGSRTIIRRPDQNSPTALVTPHDLPLVEARSFKTVHEEVDYCVAQFLSLINGGLQPHDLLAIAIDDRVSRLYLSSLAEKLAVHGVQTNNVNADKYTEPAFTIEGKVTLSTVYKSKGNEAAAVAVLGCDAVPLNSRSGRNRLFTAFTRTKGWLRITGIKAGFEALRTEIERGYENAPTLDFIMPDPKKIDIIQRDLAEKDARMQRAKAEIERMKNELGLGDEDIRLVLGSKRRNAKK